jgi:hypothetical protein
VAFELGADVNDRLVIGDAQLQGQARVEVAFGFCGLRGRLDRAQGPDPLRAALAYLAQ